VLVFTQNSGILHLAVHQPITFLLFECMHIKGSHGN